MKRSLGGWVVIRRPVRTVAWTLALIVAGVVAVGGVVLTASSSIAPIDDASSALARRDVPAQAALVAAASASAQAQAAFLDAVAAQDRETRVQFVRIAQNLTREEQTAWVEYLKFAGTSGPERELRRRHDETGEAARGAAATVLGLSPADPTYAETLRQQQELAASLQTILVELQQRFTQPVVRAHARAAESAVADAETNVFVTFGAALLLLVGVGVVVFRRAVRFERADALRSRRHGEQAHRAELETSLQRGLEMESVEEGAYGVIRQALEVVGGDHSVELLVADSSRSHFHQAVSTDDGDSAACQVGAPTECPAASSGQTRVFRDNRRIDTCPYLRDRPDGRWATCVPVSIAGGTNGVLHTEGSTDAPPDELLVPNLELVARKAGERIGVLRVLARSEAQAHVDPLTGLPNRRTLEQQAHELLESDTPFVVAFADLDHFKELNDVHGHETGDRALRLFARVLRNSIRPRDIPARYGGEEFVVVLPDCSLVDARVVAERLRGQLEAALDGGSVPDFTVSVGLAAAEPGEALSEVMGRADAALLDAKQRGRDRVLAAGNVGDMGDSKVALLR